MLIKQTILSLHRNLAHMAWWIVNSVLNKDKSAILPHFMALRGSCLNLLKQSRLL